MEPNKNQFETLLERAEEYSNTTIKLYKHKAIETSAEVVSTSVSKLTFIVIFAIAAFILSIGIAMWLGELAGKMYYGFFIVAGIYTIVGFVFYLRRQAIKQRVGDSFVSKFFND